MTERNVPRESAAGEPSEPAPRKRYEPPRLIDYGRISALTQSGGITTKDSGSMFRQGP